MKKVVMLQGLPASGKSTWAKEQVQKGNGRVKRVNKDDLRSMIDNGNWSKENEKFILTMRNVLVSQALYSDSIDTVIVDDTNLEPKHEEVLRQIAVSFGARFERETFFHIPLLVCVERDAKREKPVGAEKIRSMYQKYLAPDLQKSANADVDDPSLPVAIICDLDGTLCDIGARNPYDASTCVWDKPNAAVVATLSLFQDKVDSIILVSGRGGQFRDETIKWLNIHLPKHNGPLFMRAERDNRKDSIIKQEIYDEHIKGKYNVFFVLDDRQQVVDMWRANGLTCWQVAPGNF